jgi:hypothetical protein
VPLLQQTSDRTVQICIGHHCIVQTVLTVLYYRGKEEEDGCIKATAQAVAKIGGAKRGPE